MKHERNLKKSLDKVHVNEIVAEIMSGEFLYCCDDTKKKNYESSKEKEQEHEVGKEQSTVATYNSTLASPEKSGFHRVISASDMPIKTKVSVTVQTEDNTKPIFIIYPEESSENEFKNKVDYTNPVVLRNRTEKYEKPLPPIATILDYDKKITILDQKTHKKLETEENIKPVFDFFYYKEDIYFSTFERYVYI
jgi:transcription elongation GreA/GreB family factor